MASFLKIRKYINLYNQKNFVSHNALKTQQIYQCYSLEQPLRPSYRFSISHFPLFFWTNTVIPLVTERIFDLLSKVYYQSSVLKFVYWGEQGSLFWQIIKQFPEGAGMGSVGYDQVQKTSGNVDVSGKMGVVVPVPGLGRTAIHLVIVLINSRVLFKTSESMVFFF